MSEMDLHEGHVPESADEAAGVPAAAAEDPEAPEADALEQRAEVAPGGGGSVSATPDEVNPADHAEQQQVVALDEDDYR